MKRQESSGEEKAESSHENHKRANIRTGRELGAQRNHLAAGGAHGATSGAAEKLPAVYYYENMQLFKIAAIFGVTESRICQILGQAVTPLRDYFDRTVCLSPGD